MRLTVTVDGVAYDVLVDVEPEPAPALGSFVFGATGASTTLESVEPARMAPPTAHSDNVLRAPIAGTVLQIGVQPGQQVQVGDTLIVLEAMKMETDVTAPVSGTVASIPVQVGKAVQRGDVLVAFE